MRGFTLTHLRQLVQHTAREFMADGCTQMAAAISYYVLFSLFPLLIFAVGILGIALQDSQLQQDLIDAIQENIPLDESGDSDVANRVGDIAGAGSGALGLFGLIGMAWAGSNLFAIIRRSLNTAWDLEAARPGIRGLPRSRRAAFDRTPEGCGFIEDMERPALAVTVVVRRAGGHRHYRGYLSAIAEPQHHHP